MKFICDNYKSLKVYNEGSYIQFKDGKYETIDKKEIAVLKTTSDVILVDETVK